MGCTLDVFGRLAADFPRELVKKRPGGSGTTLWYITAPIIMNRLDEVCGPANWRNTFRKETIDGNDAIVCTLWIKVGEEWVGKENAGGFKEMTEKNRAGQSQTDEENTVKTGYTDAFKRAAVLWGIGRHLYGDGGPRSFGEPEPEHAPLPPQLPTADTIKPREEAAPDSKARRLNEWCERHPGTYEKAMALARSEGIGKPMMLWNDGQAERIFGMLRTTPEAPKAPPPSDENGQPRRFGVPISGSSLLAWCFKLRDAYKVDSFGLIEKEFVHKQGWNSNKKEWDRTQVDTAVAFMARKAKAWPGYDGQFDHLAPDLPTLKSQLAEAVENLLKKQGHANPDFALIAQHIANMSAEVPGGEVIDDLSACDNVDLLTSTLGLAKRSLDDAAYFAKGA